MISTVLNVYFSSLHIVEKDMKTKEIRKVNGDILRPVCITVEEVLDVLNHTQVECPGPDRICLRTMKLEKKVHEL